MCSSIFPSSVLWPIFTRKRRLNTAEIFPVAVPSKTQFTNLIFLTIMHDFSLLRVCQTEKVTGSWRFYMLDHYIFDF